MITADSKVNDKIIYRRSFLIFDPYKMNLDLVNVSVVVFFLRMQLTEYFLSDIPYVYELGNTASF